MLIIALPLGTLLSKSFYNGQGQFIGVHPRKNCQSGLGSDAGNFQQLAETLAFAAAGKAIQQLSIFTHHVVCEQRDFFAQMRQFIEGTHRHIQFITYPTDINHNLWRQFFDDLPGNTSNHKTSSACWLVCCQ